MDRPRVSFSVVSYHGEVSERRLSEMIAIMAANRRWLYPSNAPPFERDVQEAIFRREIENGARHCFYEKNGTLEGFLTYMIVFDVEPVEVEILSFQVHPRSQNGRGGVAMIRDLFMRIAELGRTA